MSNNITGKIVGFRVNDKKEETPKVTATPKSVAVKKPEPLAAMKREDVLEGKTYKIKPPETTSLYVTINNDGEKPFEIFINSKDTQHFQWTTGLTRVISAVMRRESREDQKFLIDELKSVVDPNGGYWVKGKYIRSIVSEIGMVLEQHMNEQKPDVVYPPNAVICHVCGEKAMIKSDGCETCVACDHSKCS